MKKQVELVTNALEMYLRRYGKRLLFTVKPVVGYILAMRYFGSQVVFKSKEVLKSNLNTTE